MCLLCRFFYGLVLLVAVLGTPSVAQSNSAAVPLQQRVWVATRIYSYVSTYFGHWRGVPDNNLDQLFPAYLNRILPTDDRHTFDLATMELIAQLRNGHSAFDDEWLKKNFGQQLGFYAYPIDNHWVVSRSSIGSLKPGDVISSINGQKIEDFFQALRKYVSASDERWARRSFFEYSYLFPRSFSLALAGGREVPIVRQGEFVWPGGEYADITVGQQEGVPYIRIPSFDNAKFEDAALRALRGFASAKAIIIDVRGNHGGSTPEKLTAALMDRPYRWWSESTPISIGLFRFQGELGQHSDVLWYGDVQRPGKDAYRGALYILADGGCFSACEDFLVAFKDNHRATLVGERTAGSSGQPFSADLGDGMGIGLSTKREFFPDGSEFEGVGIAPDVEVHLTLEEVRSSRDPILGKALKLIQGKQE